MIIIISTIVLINYDAALQLTYRLYTLKINYMCMYMYLENHHQCSMMRNGWYRLYRVSTDMPTSIRAAQLTDRTAVVRGLSSLSLYKRVWVALIKTCTRPSRPRARTHYNQTKLQSNNYAKTSQYFPYEICTVHALRNCFRQQLGVMATFPLGV